MDVFASGRKEALGTQSGIETALCQRKTEGESKNGLANLWNRKRITKKSHTGRGLETIWEIPIHSFTRHGSHSIGKVNESKIEDESLAGKSCCHAFRRGSFE